MTRSADPADPTDLKAFAQRVVRSRQPAETTGIAESATTIAARLAADPDFTAALSEEDHADLNWAAAGGNIAAEGDAHLGGRPSRRLRALKGL